MARASLRKSRKRYSSAAVSEFHASVPILVIFQGPIRTSSSLYVIVPVVVGGNGVHFDPTRRRSIKEQVPAVDVSGARDDGHILEVAQALCPIRVCLYVESIGG